MLKQDDLILWCWNIIYIYIYTYIYIHIYLYIYILYIHTWFDFEKHMIWGYWGWFRDVSFSSWCSTIRPRRSIYHPDFGVLSKGLCLNFAMQQILFGFSTEFERTPPPVLPWVALLPVPCWLELGLVWEHPGVGFVFFLIYTMWEWQQDGTRIFASSVWKKPPSRCTEPSFIWGMLFDTHNPNIG